MLNRAHPDQRKDRHRISARASRWGLQSRRTARACWGSRPCLRGNRRHCLRKQAFVLAGQAQSRMKAGRCQTNQPAANTRPTGCSHNSIRAMSRFSVRTLHCPLLALCDSGIRAHERRGRVQPQVRGLVGTGARPLLFFTCCLNVQRFRQQFVAKCVVCCVKFQHRLPRVQAARQGRHGRQQVQVCRDRDGAAPDVVHHRREMRMASASTRRYSRDPAKGANLGLRDIEPPVFQHGAPAPAVEFGLAARDVDLQPGAQLAVAVKIFGATGSSNQ